MAIQPTSNPTIARAEVLSRNTGAGELPVAPRPAAAPTEAAPLVQQPDAVSQIVELERAIRNINQTVQVQASNLEFEIDPDSQRTIVKIVDQQTKEVLRQVPSEEVLSIAKALDQAIGLLIRQKA